MNSISRGIKNATRSPLRAGAIVLMLSISIALLMSMLVARASINSKIAEVKSSAGTAITISPAGVQGFMGGGDPFDAEQVEKISSTEHIISTTASLTDQLGSDDTDLESALEIGSFGQRQMRFESSGGSSMSFNRSEDAPELPPITQMSRTTVTGTTDPNSQAATGGSLTIKEGEIIDGASDDLVALIGATLATKNELSAGDTFEAYDKTFTVKGIFETGNQFQDSGIIMPLKTLQTATDQEGAAISVVANADSSENVAGAIAALKEALGDDADITSNLEQAEQNVASLESIASLALIGVIGSAVAGGVIMLLAMIIVVRERRREIGVMKAIGAPDLSVITQFVSEALTLTFIGCVMGLIIGVSASTPITAKLASSNTQNEQQVSMPPINGEGGMPGGFRQQAGQRFAIGRDQALNTIGEISSTVTPETFAWAIGITFLIALLGSAVPAWAITNIKPAEVLRSE